MPTNGIPRKVFDYHPIGGRKKERQAGTKEMEE
jgi:hypothetical protein